MSFTLLNSIQFHTPLPHTYVSGSVNHPWSSTTYIPIKPKSAKTAKWVFSTKNVTSKTKSEKKFDEMIQKEKFMLFKKIESGFPCL